jgi:adenosylmethionine-8-amino-7-oxononanoate aminotransferase
MTIAQPVSPALDLQQAARDHLWLHFTRMGGLRDADVPIIVRGDGCYLEDVNGKRYLDALAGLFSVNVGYGFGEEMGQAALEQMRELPFYTNWSYAHPRAIELAAEVADLTPGDLNRVFFVSGGSEAVESAWKLARQFYLARGEKQLRDIVTPGARAGAQEPETMHDAIVAGVGRPSPRRYKAVARHIAYHGTTFGALSINGIPAIRAPFEPLVPEVRHVHNTNRYHRPIEETEAEFTEFLLDDLEQTILSMGPETVCLVHMEPVQNAGGAFTPPAGYWRGVREICDRYDILLSADEVITAFGRLGYWFGSERYDIRPDIVCSAKGLSSSYASIGAVIATDRVMEPFLEATSMYSHGITFGGHPVACAVALKNIEIMKRERIVEGVLEHEDAFRSTLAQLLDLPIVGDLRGTGFFYALELVKDKETRETFTDEECETLLRGYLSQALYDAGLICRADDRGDPVVQISPPLVARQSEFDQIVGTLGDVLSEAWRRMMR